MTLKAKQLKDLKEKYIDNGKTLVVYAQDNSIEFGPKLRREWVGQLKAKYGDDVMKVLRDSLKNKRFEMMARNIVAQPKLTVEDCDVMIASLNTALTLVSEKKTELEG